MALNENLGALMNKAGDIAQVAARKAKDVAGIAKAKVSILAEEDKIKKAQQEIGKLYYTDFSAGNTINAAEYLPWCEKITAAKKAIDDLRASIEEYKNSNDAAEASSSADDSVTDADFADSDFPEIEVVPDDSEQPEEFQ